jgi:hypothetical protein
MTQNIMATPIGGTMNTPQVSTVMPNPMTTPQVSTVMPNPTNRTGVGLNLVSSNTDSFQIIRVTEDTPNLQDILAYPVDYMDETITLYSDVKSNTLYSVSTELKENSSQILSTRNSGIANIIKDITPTVSDFPAPTDFGTMLPSLDVNAIYPPVSQRPSEDSVEFNEFASDTFTDNSNQFAFANNRNQSSFTSEPSTVFRATNTFFTARSVDSTQAYNRMAQQLMYLPVNTFYASR